MPLISLVDYGVGNLYSVKNSLEKCGGTVRVVTDMSELVDSECIVFPGVGAFDETMDRLTSLHEKIIERLECGVPTLGICIGAQILFDSSEEGLNRGLGLIDGRVMKMKGKKLPHMGWNKVTSEDLIMDGVSNKWFYFANSYYGCPSDCNFIKGTSEYEGSEFPVMFRRYNTYGLQFHPEKSSASGMVILKNFIKFAEGCRC